MSTPLIAAAVVGAFILGLLCGAWGSTIWRRPPPRSATPVDVVDVSSADADVSHSRVEPDRPTPAAARREYVITSAGEPESELDRSPRREFAPRPQFEQVARTLMIEAVSLAHGVRDALSEENRAKISYEIKRELIRVRRDRKAEAKVALQEYRAKHRAPVDPDSTVTGQGEGA